MPGAGRAQEVLIREIASREFSIHVGGVESDPVKEVASREYSIHIENGSQDLVHEVVSREYDVLITSSESPPAVTPLVVTPSPTGESVTLDWSGYNQWAVKDIVRFDIYLTDSGPFSDVAGMTPVATIGAGATGITLNDLTAYTDHYIAVVAVDGLGNRTTAVNYSAAYILSPQTISREFSLFIGQEPEPPYKEVVSREYDIVITSPEPPPAIPEIAVTVSPVGDTATLDWSAYNQWAVRDILRFDIYLSDAGAFGSVAGMTPVASAGAGTTSIILTGLTPGTDHFFAVVPVDALGNYDADVTYSAAYVLSPQVISREFSLFIGNEPPVPPPSVEDMPLANFSFESPDVSNWMYWGSMSAAQKTAFAWTGGGNGTNGPALYNNGSAWNYTSVPDGAQGVSLQGDSTLSTTVDFPTTGDYYLEWSDASRGGQVNPYEIRLGTRVVSLPFSTSATAWRRNALRFTVSAAGSATLTFAGLNPAGGDNSVGIDNVSLGRVTADGVRPSPEQRELASREYSIVVPDATVPAPVTGTGSGFSAVTSSAAFGAVDLDWTSYNEAVQTDVVRYRVYVGTAFFDTVTGLTPYEYVQTGQQRHTVTGLNGLGIYHFAVVAEDILGNFDPAVRSFSAQASISGVGEAVNLAGVSGRTSLTYTWAAPPDAGAFLQGYRIHFGGNPPVQLPATATSWEATALLPGTGYPFRITTLDAFGGESAGVSLLGSTWLPNPANVRLVARNGNVVLQWDAVQPAAVVGHYAVYRSGAAFTNVTAAMRISEDPATEAVLGTFTETTGRHYAVATVNSLGGMDPSVVSISATKLPQTITFPALTPGPLSIPLTATASSGLPVVFFSSPSSVASVASVEGTNLVVHRGGTVTVTAAQDGNAQFWAASASQTLRLPPVITGFRAGGAELVNGAVLSAPSVVLDVTALDAAGVVTAEFFRRAAGQSAWTSLGLDNTPGDGWKATLPVASLPDGNYDLLVTVRTLDGSSASRQQSVALALAPVLTLTLGDTIVEGSALNGTVSIGLAAAAPVTVTIASSRPTQLNPGPPVTIPAGQTSAPFSLQGTQDIEIEGPQEVRITASTPGAADAQDTVTLLDDDWPQITLTLDRSLVSEADGANAAIATITRDPATARPLTVWLRNSSPAAASLPEFVEIAAGNSSISFPVGAVDDTNTDGTQTANLKAEVRLADGTVISESPTFTLQVGDDEGPRLELSYPPGFLMEGSTGSVTVRRSGGSTASALSVSLTALPTGQLTLPASVSIPAGAAQATFNITGVSDAADGSAPVRVSAAAASHSPAQTEIVVTDLQKPDLTVAEATAPPAAETESLFTVSYRLENKGPAAAAGPFVQRILLSTDPAPGNDILLAQSSFTTSLNSGAWLERSESVRAPREAGTYWVLVTADASGAVDEILETNNTVIAAEPITVGAAYTASVQTSVTRVPANTPIPLTGSATKAGGLKVPFVMVNIHIRVAGTERVIAAITNAAGDFSTTWRPLPGEGGDYEIGAAHPGVSTTPTQDTFAILTAKAEFPADTIVFEEASSVSLTGTISNPTAYPLTGLSLTAVSPPAGLNVNASLASASLAPGLSQSAGVSLSAAAGYFGDSTLTLRLTSTEGVTIDIPLRLSVRPLLPKLSANPSPIAASVLRGSQKSVTFTVTNSGGAATGPLRVLMPVSPWIQLASPETLESIPPEGTAEVTLLLAPSATEALTLFNGSLVLDPASGASLTVPFAFRVVSGQTGNLQIEAVDESYYFTAEAPKVSGATVTLRDAISAEQINVQTTGADGRSSFINIAEGWYNVEVDTPNHTRWSGNIFVNAGETTFRQVFISREWVTYTWKVEEIEIQDRYRVSVETTFETNVPAPVVTVSPAVLDLEDVITLGQTKVVYFTIENHGLIAANHGAFTFDQHPFYEIKPLIEDLGTIPAKSSLTVPVTVRRVGVFAADGSIQTLPGFGIRRPRDGEPSVPCGLSGRVAWDYTCGNTPIEKLAVIPGSGVQGRCEGGPGGPGSALGQTSPGQPGKPVQVTFATPNKCDCKLLDFLQGCLDGSVSWDLDGITRRLVQKIGKALPSFIKPSDFSTSVALEGEICTCCDEEGNWGLEGSAKVKLAIEVELIIGVSYDDLFEVEGSWGSWNEVELDIDGFVGAKPSISGEVELAVEYDCEGKIKMCLNGKVGGQISVGGEIKAEVEAERGGKKYIGSVGGELTINGSVEAWARGCCEKLDIDSCTFKMGACAEVSAVARLGGELTEENGSLTAAFGGSITASKSTGTCLADADKRDNCCGGRPPRDGLPAAPESLEEAVSFADVAYTPAEIIDRHFDNGSSGVCATVKLKTDQSLVLTRSAFRAGLELVNNQPNGSLSNIRFDLEIEDVIGRDAGEHFNVRVSRLTGLSDIGGGGVLNPLSVGSAEWTIIPRDSAALTSDTVYFVGGSISYTQGGVLFSIPVTPSRITVKPDAALYLKYFHQRDVFSDDPFTVPVEPSQPFSLAVMVENRGAGAARRLSITSAQPEIVDNEKGLLIDFQIIGTEVAGQNLSPSLSADFGDVPPGQRRTGTWLMTSSLQGLFIDYKATFEHLDGFGDPRLSLIKQVEIHEMIHMVEALGTLSDGQPDFLVNDVADIRDLPDTIHLSDGTTAPVALLETGTASGAPAPGSLSVQISAAPGAGWTYLRIPDPANGAYRLTGVQRSDGLTIPVEKNAWVTDRTFIGLGRAPVRENILHLLDFAGTGLYTLTYEPLPAGDTTAPVSAVAALPAQSAQAIPVTWSGTDASGIVSYDLFYRVDGGAWQPWLTETLRTSAIFNGATGRTYGFYSIATDAAGNREVAPAAADASTTVSLTNAAPAIAAIPAQFVSEGGIFEYQITASDPDGGSAPLFYTLASVVPGIVIDDRGQIRWVTGEGDGGRSADVTVTVTDSGGPPASASRSFRISVGGSNSSPVFAGIPAQSVVAGDLLTVQLSATDGDVPAQTLTYSLANAPEGMTANSTSGLITWIPQAPFAGQSYLVEAVAADSGTPSAQGQVAFTVTVLAPPNRAPVFGALPVQIWFPGETQTFTVPVTDPEGQPLTILADTTSLPGTASITPAGVITWAVPTGTRGTFPVLLTASDGIQQSSASLIVRVEPRSLYWEWAHSELTSVSSPSDLEMLADPDEDGIQNVFEMTFLLNPLASDTIPIEMSLSGPIEDDWHYADLTIFRRRGSHQLVQIIPQTLPSAESLAWADLIATDYDVMLDAHGNVDGDPSSEEVTIRMLLEIPEGVPSPPKLFRIKSIFRNSQP